MKKKVEKKKDQQRIIDKKSVVIYLLVALFLITLSFGVSYAYFTADVTGNEPATESRVTAGTLKVDFTITDKISNSNIMLIKDSDRATRAESIPFSVSNNGNLAGQYMIYLTDLSISNNLKSEDFKWELIKNGTTTYAGNFTTATSGTLFPLTSIAQGGSVTPVSQSLAVGSTDNYVLRVWLSETQEDQTSLLGGTFSAKVQMISTTQASA